jgi:N-acetylmuramoyl-L-alanine amidase
LASRANHYVLLSCVLLCAAALLCSQLATGQAAEDLPSKPVAASGIPVVSDVRLAGDDKQTRFIIDLDKTISFRAFPLADPYRVVLDIPQVSFQLPAGVGTAGRGLIKGFRYGLVMPGGSRIVFDLNGPARIANSYVLEAANGQPARLVLELEEVDRTAFVQSLSPDNRPELRPAIATAKDTLVTTVATIEAKAEVPAKSADAPDRPDAAADLRPVIVIDPGHGGIDNGTQSGSEY